MTAPKPPFTIKGWHVLVGVIVFFAIIIATDVTFAVLAYRSAPGQVAGKPYETGLAYNREIARHAAAKALGWTATADTAPAKGGRQVLVDIAGRDGKPVTGLTVSGELVRPATEEGRHTLVFRESAPGRYAAEVPAAPGAWDLGFSAKDRKGDVFSGERRLIWR
ncbi:MAG: FixH family protein [Caulobacteraceae bacterium]